MAFPGTTWKLVFRERMSPQNYLNAPCLYLLIPRLIKKSDRLAEQDCLCATDYGGKQFKQ